MASVDAYVIFSASNLHNEFTLNSIYAFGLFRFVRLFEQEIKNYIAENRVYVHVFVQSTNNRVFKQFGYVVAVITIILHGILLCCVFVRKFCRCRRPIAVCCFCLAVYNLQCFCPLSCMYSACGQIEIAVQRHKQNVYRV